jgi:hypothetical protein
MRLKTDTPHYFRLLHRSSPHGQPSILSDVSWGFVEASLNERQAEKFWSEEVGAQGDA